MVDIVVCCFVDFIEEKMKRFRKSFPKKQSSFDEKVNFSFDNKKIIEKNEIPEKETILFG